MLSELIYNLHPQLENIGVLLTEYFQSCRSGERETAADLQAPGCCGSLPHELLSAHSCSTDGGSPSRLSAPSGTGPSRFRLR